MSTAVTEGVLVEVTSAYIPARSSPEESAYFFAYTVRIANGSAASVQLVSRHWIITDGRGRVEEVRGPGVIGQQPVIRPGEAFQYTSACPLTTSHGTMCGSYQMLRDDGARFDAEIAPFELAVPSESRARLMN
ncbi:MAG: Co2+/Mg2+ efflux protein ApaG [Myxococcales bacterium]|nr:Co2+/Mg2+ efflux protein ApaG [Myxococcales bacterium]